MRRLFTLAQLQEYGRTLGRELPPQAVVWLEGDLGAGKTTLVQAIAAGLGVAMRATSPTYGLVHRYDHPDGGVYHVDCYRLRTPAEAAEIDWEGLRAARALLIEWPARAGVWAPPPSIRIQLEHDDDEDCRWLETVK